MLFFRLSQRKYSELHNEYFDYACQFIWRMTKEKDETEEIVQLAFIKLFKSLKTFKEESTLKTYFTRILINTFYDETKKKRKNQLSLDEVTVEEHDDSVKESDIEAYLQVATPTQRTCLALFYQDGFSVLEIAAILDASEGTVKSHLSRGRATIKQFLSTKECDHDSK